MKKYRVSVECGGGGHDIGQYDATDEDGALDAMARAHTFENFADLIRLNHENGDPNLSKDHFIVVEIET